METILQIKGLSCYYPLPGGESLQVVRGVTFEMREGEILGIVGASGSGKSTLARAMLGTFSNLSGKILFKGEDLYGRGFQRRKRKPIQMIFQDSKSSLNPRMTLFESMEEPLILAGVKDKRKRAESVKNICQRVGLDQATAEKIPGECSGGQRQRASIGRALVLEPEVLILDEPVASLDASIQAKIINLLKKISEETQMTMVFISHHEELVKVFCHRIMVMDGSLHDQEGYIYRDDGCV